MKHIIMFSFMTPILLCAQLISLKSLPVITGDQFLLTPSKNIAMGGVNLALKDEWADPFRNPAAGMHITENAFFLQPSFYSISDNLGGARTLPATLFYKKGVWFATLSASFQQLEGANTSNPNWFSQQTNGPKERYNNNTFATISLGRSFEEGLWSIGASLSYADLNAIGGVDLLYANSTNISQNGTAYELRGGLTFQEDNYSFELMGLYSNYEMMQKVTYREWVWNDIMDDGIFQDRIDLNPDYTDTWGAYMVYREQANEKIGRASCRERV